MPGVKGSWGQGSATVYSAVQHTLEGDMALGGAGGRHSWRLFALEADINAVHTAEADTKAV